MHETARPIDERRRSQRIRLSTLTVLNVEGRGVAARLEDVSRGGALLRLDEEVGSDQSFSWISIPFGRDPEEAIAIVFRIVHVAPPFMRVQWEEQLPPEDWIKLRRLMEWQFGTLTVVHKPLPMLIWPNARLKGNPSPG